MVPLAVVTSTPAPNSAATGDLTTAIRLAPVAVSALYSASRSTRVSPEGQVTHKRHFSRFFFFSEALSIRAIISRAAISTSATAPCCMGSSVSASPRVRLCMARA